MNTIKVHSIFRQDELAMIKSILDACSINYSITNENAHMYPPGVFTLGTGMDVMVEESQAEEAKRIIKDFKDITK